MFSEPVSLQFLYCSGRESFLPGDMLRPHLLLVVAKNARTIAEHTACELEDLGQARAAAEHRMEAVSEYEKARWDAAITKMDSEIWDHILLRNEQKYGLEYNWVGPSIITDKNTDTNVY